MIHHLADRGFIHLHHIQHLSVFPHINQLWLATADLEISVDESIIWDRYILSLQNSFVHLSNKPNV